MILSTTMSSRSSMLYVPSPSCRRISRILSTRISADSSSRIIVESDPVFLVQYDRVIVCPHPYQIVEKREKRDHLPAGRPCPWHAGETRDWIPPYDLAYGGILPRCSDGLISIRSC